MTIESDHDLQKLKEIGRIVALTLKAMQRRTEPEMTTAELDVIGKNLLDSYDAVSAPKDSYDFPGYTCISVNHEAAHGVPGDKVIKAGDVVNIDVSAHKDGYYADTGASFVVPPSSALKERLLRSTKLALMQACANAQAGSPLNHIGKAIQGVAKQSGFKVIKNLCSHGVGKALHEEPAEIPGFYDPQDRRRLHSGLVITIEPFLSTRNQYVTEANDGWTLVGSNNNLSAQFEHTMVITKRQPILLTVA